MSKETAVGEHISVALFQRSESGREGEGARSGRIILTITWVRNTRKWIEMLRDIVKKEIVSHDQAVLTCMFIVRKLHFDNVVLHVPTNIISFFSLKSSFWSAIYSTMTLPDQMWSLYLF